MSDMIDPNAQVIDLLGEEVTETIKEIVSEETVAETPEVAPVFELLYDNVKPVPENVDPETIDIPPSNMQKLEKQLGSVSNIDRSKSPEERKWISSIKESLEYLPAHNMMSEIGQREKADFKQGIKTAEGMQVPSQPRLPDYEGRMLQGERAVLYARQRAGLGAMNAVPLSNSGFWVTFKAPSDSELIELNRMLFNDKIMLGRYTYGLMFSNITAYTVDRIVGFALDHVFESTLKSDLVGTRGLKDLISCQDIPVLLAGFLRCIYSKGYKYRRACVANPDKCTHIEEGMVDFNEMIHIDNSKFNDYQLTHMSSRQRGSRVVSDVIRYKEELNSKVTSSFTIKVNDSSSITFKLKTPSVTEYVDSGYKWITSLVSIVESAIQTEESKEDRDAYLSSHSQASLMRQYGHWVKSIDIDTNTVEDRETIDMLLTEYSSDDTIRDEFTKNVIKYIEDTTLGIVGIPEYDCPVCSGKSDTHHVPRFSNVIPLDVVALFFSLTGQRLSKISQR